MDLFAQQEEANRQAVMPLAARMRPSKISEFVGQQHFLGEGKLLRRLLAARRLGSILFYGPPGTGKTTLAHLLAVETGGRFQQLNAVTSGVKELRDVLAWARDEVSTGGARPLLFVDEIHRFSKAQQDALLPDVESGVVSLIGATTSNPFFCVGGALLSRSQIFQFHSLSVDEILTLVETAIKDTRRGLGHLDIEYDMATLRYLAESTDGDARRALSVLEIAILSTSSSPVYLTKELIADSMQQRIIRYDRDGDEHYDVSSALIKSIRGSDPDAAVYWLARMLEAGEDIRFVCRRLVILASEDIGNADPQALVVAVSAAQACELVGLPECQLTLSQAVIYLACAEKSNAATLAIGSACQDVREKSVLPVPRHLRDAHYEGAKTLGHGAGYRYSHDSESGVVDQDYLGVERQYFYPSARGWEAKMACRLEALRTESHSKREK
ncbi:MAG: replication-associated recombination protein A [Planctomycetales bacterium]|nr:replication-associated recombination protein A [Planctomycetales bacterium]